MTTALTKKEQLANEFISHAVTHGILRFGGFKTKAGRLSPYFFNAGLYDDGAKLSKLAEFYAKNLLLKQVSFDMIFGPAYKGITLAAAVAIELARLGKNVPYAYNRKEAKDHGEGGSLVGAPLQGNVLIIDDVVSAGTSVRESIILIQQAGATPCGVSIALDRQEKATSINAQGEVKDEAYSAAQYIEQTHQIPVVSIASLEDLLRFLETDADNSFSHHYQQVMAYRKQFGVS